MALITFGAFVAGFSAGWITRSFTHSTRGALVGLIAGAHRAHDEVSRILAQAIEWSEDLAAEGKARYETIEETEGSP